jgi:hypothetical protein
MEHLDHLVMRFSDGDGSPDAPLIIPLGSRKLPTP